LGTPHERVDVIAAVYARWREIELEGRRPALRAVGREFGLDPSTIRRYVELGRQADSLRPVYDRMRTGIVVHEALGELLEDSLADGRAAKDGKERAAHRMVTLAVIDRVVRMHGLNAPTRVRIEQDEAGPDPDLVAAVSDEIRALQSRERERALDPARDEED